MSVAQRRQECGRLLGDIETLKDTTAKAKALNKVREVFGKLKSVEVQQNIRNTADLGIVNVQAVRTIRGLVDGLEDRILAQQLLSAECLHIDLPKGEILVLEPYP